MPFYTFPVVKFKHSIYSYNNNNNNTHRHRTHKMLKFY